MTESPEELRGRRWSRWRWMWLTAIGLSSALAIFVVSGAALDVLRVDETTTNARAIALLSGDFRFELAADELRKQAVDRVLMVESYPERVVRMKLLPPRESMALQRLSDAGVAGEAIEIIPCKSRTLSQSLECLADWLERHPDIELLVYCDQLQGRRTELARSRVVKPETAARMHIVCLTDHDFDSKQWWRHRLQVRAVANAWFDMALDFVFGDVPPKLDTWDPDVYERSLR